MSDEFPDDDNGDVLRRMQQNGDRFEIARDVDFSVVFPDEGGARTFAAHFERLGYRASAERSNVRQDRPWDVTVVKPMAISYAGITAFEEELQLAAAPFGGQNDGWGCFNQKEEASG